MITQPWQLLVTILMVAAVAGIVGYLQGHSAGFKLGWHECEKFAANAMKHIAKELGDG